MERKWQVRLSPKKLKGTQSTFTLVLGTLTSPCDFGEDPEVTQNQSCD